MGLLKKKIDDKRFLNLIRQMLKAGFVENFKHNQAYSGTPQGGVISPLLSNIYLHELDVYMDELKGAIDSGGSRRINPEYQRYTHRIRKYRKEINSREDDPQRVEELKSEIKRLMDMRDEVRTQAEDPSYKRVMYVRYADDFVIGLAGSKEDASRIYGCVRDFIRDNLKLEVNEDKTKTRTFEEGFRFLGYDVRLKRNNGSVKTVRSGWKTKSKVYTCAIDLRVPEEKLREFCISHQYGDYDGIISKHRTNLVACSVPEMILAYNQELKGFCEYYKLDYHIKSRVGRLLYIANHSLYKTIANKLRLQSMGKVIELLKRENGERVWLEKRGDKVIPFTVFRAKHQRC